MKWTFQADGIYGEWLDASMFYSDTLAEAIEMFLINLDYAKREGIL